MMSPTDPQATSAPSAAAQTPSALPPLRLRFRGGQHDGQVVRINANKCTIGSAPNATLRLSCAGVHPIHCLIMNGSGGTAIRSMSPDTLLNGEAFEDAVLTDGDVLSVGPLQLEMVAPAPEPVAASTAPPAANAPVDDGALNEARAEAEHLRVRVETLEATNNQLVDKLDEVTARYEEANALATKASEHTSEQDDHLEELNALREQVAQFESLAAKKQDLELQVTSLQEQIQQTNTQNAQRDADLKAAAEQLVAFESVNTAHDRLSREVVTLQKQMDQAEDYCRKWEVQHQQLESDLAAANLLNAEKDSEILALREKLANGGASNHQAPAYAQPEITQPEIAQSDVAQPEFTAPADPEAPEPVVPQVEQPDVSQPVTQTQATQTMSMDDFNALADAGVSQAATPEAAPSTDTVSQTMIFEEGQSFDETPQDSAMAMLDKLRAELGAPAGQPEPAADPVPEEAPQTVKIPAVNTPATEDELEFSEPESAAPVDTASILAKFGHSAEALPEDSPSLETPQPEPAAPAAEEDDSIQDYMAQLMQRVGGDEAAAAPEKKKPKPAAPKPKAETPKPAASAKPKPVAKPLDPSEFVPRAVAPEASSGLKALRAVANTSTRSAIDRHQRRSLDSKAVISGFVALVAFGVCVAMGYLALNAPNLVSVPTLLSLSSGFIGVLAAVKALAFSARSALGSRRQQNLKQLSAR